MASAVTVNMRAPAMPPDPHTDVEGFSRSLEHAKSGYANAQDIIKFLDTKAGVVTGLVTVLLGLPLLVAQWIIEREGDSPFCWPRLFDAFPELAIVALGLVIISVACGILSVVNTVFGLRARLPPARGKPPILFPLYPPHKYRQAAKSFGRLGQGLTAEEILHEYELQLLRTGQILHEKGGHLSRAINYFLAQFVLFALSVILLIVIPL